VARPSKRVRRQANIECNDCGHRFVDRAWFESYESDERGTIGWTPADDVTRCSGARRAGLGCSGSSSSDLRRGRLDSTFHPNRPHTARRGSPEISAQAGHSPTPTGVREE